MEASTRTETIAVDLGSELQRALASGEIEAFFQPKVNCHLESVSSLEALVRWRHPVLGLLNPADILEQAERQGLTTAVTDRVLDMTLDCLNQWDRSGHRFSASVNLATEDLLDPGLLSRLERALRHHSIDPARLTVEITEDVTLGECDKIRNRIRTLRQGGMRISLDDFGSGATSLVHLTALPIDELKIDRSIVSRCRTITEAVVRLGLDLGFHVVAEGADDRDTVEDLKAFGCHQIQGFHFAKPMPADEVPGWVEQFNARSPRPSLRQAHLS